MNRGEESVVAHERGIPRIFAVRETDDGVTIWIPGFCEFRATDREKARRSWKSWIRWYGEQVGPHVAALYLAGRFNLPRPGTFEDLLQHCRRVGLQVQLAQAVELAKVLTAERVFRLFKQFYKFTYERLPRRKEDDLSEKVPWDLRAFECELHRARELIELSRQRVSRRAVGRTKPAVHAL